MGLDLNQVYCRLHLRYYFTGDKVDVWAQTYASKQAFEENINNSFEVDGISRQYQFDYDRERDGADIMLYCHEQIKGLLTTDVTEQQEFEMIDEKSEKYKEIREVIVKEKFANDTEVQIELKDVR